MTEESVQGALERLRLAVVRISWASTKQREYLLDLGVGLADELALEFDDALQPLRHFLDDLCISIDLQDSLLAIECKLEEMSNTRNGTGSLWQLDDLDHADRWQELRAIAQDVIARWP